MGRTLTYNFGRYDEDEFDFTDYDIQDYISEKFDEGDLKELAIYIFNEILDNDSQLEWKNNYPGIVNLPNGDISNSNYVEFIKDIVSEYADDEEVFDYLEDDLKNHYESEAYEQYLDYEAYRKDPLGYNGMSLSDFI